MRGPSLRRSMLGVAVLAASAVTGAVDAAGPRELLPNLVALRGTTVALSCHPTETADDPAPRRCLRYETHAANVGAGPLEMHFRVDSYATTRSVVQRVFRSDGTYRDTAAGTYVLHAAHAHFHYDDFAAASLWRADAKGRRLDRNPVRQGSKVGFCLEDVYPYRAAPPARYSYPAACYPNHVSPEGEAAQVSGISPGWVDAYDVTVPHQYVEVTGVPDGYYLIRVVVDPTRRLRETTTKDNVVWQHIRLCGDAVDVVGRTANCG